MKELNDSCVQRRNLSTRIILILPSSTNICLSFREQLFEDAFICVGTHIEEVKTVA